MTFLIAIALIVIFILLFDHFNPDSTDVLFAAVCHKQLKEGRIAFEARQIVERPLSGGTSKDLFRAGGIMLLVDQRLSSIVALKSSTGTKMQRKNCEETVDGMLVDRVAVDASGSAVAALVIKGSAPGVVLDILRSANIKSFVDQASFDAEVERHASRKTTP